MGPPWPSEAGCSWLCRLSAQNCESLPPRATGLVGGQGRAVPPATPAVGEGRGARGFVDMVGSSAPIGQDHPVWAWPTDPGCFLLRAD
jgi:hypothetical protein